ncbi:MAG TPA: hypothetical protein VF719_13700, partial [Abditibacteriaceae bacterium]
MKKHCKVAGVALALFTSAAFATGPVGIRETRADNVMHIGHSLMEKEMPQFVKTLADEAGIPHSYSYQLIIGSPLTYQWGIGDFDEETQKTQKGRQGVGARASLASGKFDALIMCDATPVLTHLKWGSLESAPKFYELALRSNSKTRVYLYHFWPSLDAPNYNAAFAEELKAYETIADTMVETHAAKFPKGKVSIVPAGAAVVELKRRIEARQVPGIASIRDIYSDDIHLTPKGMYLVALVHFATLYGKNPTGLGAHMKNEWGQTLVNLPPATAKVFQEIAWEAVT